jgi:hypothetical protein
MRGKEVIYRIPTTVRVGEDMVRRPWLVEGNSIAADVAPTAGLLEYSLTFFRRQPTARLSRSQLAQPATATLRMKPAQKLGEGKAG